MPAAHPSSRRLCGQARPGRGGDTGVAIAALTTIDGGVQSDLARFLHFLLCRPFPRFRLRHSRQPCSGSQEEGNTQDCDVQILPRSMDSMLDACQACRHKGGRTSGGLMFGIESGVTSHRRLVLHPDAPRFTVANANLRLRRQQCTVLQAISEKGALERGIFACQRQRRSSSVSFSRVPFHVP